MQDSHTENIDASDAAAHPSSVRERLERSGRAETLTASGEPIGVVMSHATYERLRAAEDAEMIRLSHEQCQRGEVRDASAFFDDLEAKLNRMKNTNA